MPHHLSEAQLDGRACIHCGSEHEPMRPVEAWSELSSQLFEQYGLVSKATFPYKTIRVIRKDWLDRLGLTVPKTLDEFLTVMKAFREQDPNGTGLHDTFGYSANIAADEPFRPDLRRIRCPRDVADREWQPGVDDNQSRAAGGPAVH
jgi:hypothetical protein